MPNFLAQFSLDPMLSRFHFIGVAILLLALCGCAEDRYRWSLSHARISPKARQLPQSDLEEIIRIITAASSNVIIGVGQSCTERTLDEMHVVTEYSEDRVMVYDLKKTDGRWKITDHGDGDPLLSTVWISC
jgi:hypothetical protein